MHVLYEKIVEYKIRTRVNNIFIYNNIYFFMFYKLFEKFVSKMR